MTDNTVSIKNLGPITDLEFNVVPGGITVLKGRNGCGKTTALNAVKKLQTESKNIRLTSRDGTTGGQADGFGVRVKISRAGANKMAGECEVSSIEGDLNISDFVDPGMKSDSAADAKRIKSLVVLTGASADETMFHDLLTGGKDEFLALVPQEAREETDLLDMSQQIKRAIEQHARIAEEQAKTASSEAQALKDLIEGVDLDAESDEAVLEDATVAARDELVLKKDAVNWFDDNQAAYDSAKESLSHDPGGDVQGISEEIERLKSTREKLKESLIQVESDLKVAEAKFQSAESAEQQRASLQSLVEQFEKRKKPTEKEIAKLQKEFEEAKAARDRGVEIRNAKDKSVKITEYLEAKKKAERRAEDLRTAAKGTEDVLAEVIKESCPQLRVDEDFRLVTDHPVRGECYFSELSEGERWKIGIAIAVSVFKKKEVPGLLGVPQECWESLDSKNRQVILESIEGTNLGILTAEANHVDGEPDEIHVATIGGEA